MDVHDPQITSLLELGCAGTEISKHSMYAIAHQDKEKWLRDLQEQINNANYAMARLRTVIWNSKS